MSQCAIIGPYKIERTPAGYRASISVESFPDFISGDIITSVETEVTNHCANAGIDALRHSPETFARCIGKRHPTLQRDTIRAMIEALKYYASIAPVDGRNIDAVEAARIISQTNILF